MDNAPAARAARRFTVAGLLALGAALSGGCGSGPYPVKGKVVWEDGSPAKELLGSQVVFESAEKRTSSRGTVGADGTFRISTNQPDDGAFAGQYKVFIIENRASRAKWEGDQTLVDPIMDLRFSHMDKSGLTVVVEPHDNLVTLTVARARPSDSGH